MRIIGTVLSLFGACAPGALAHSKPGTPAVHLDIDFDRTITSNDQVGREGRSRRDLAQARRRYSY
jgi:hypothetical protein